VRESVGEEAHRKIHRELSHRLSAHPARAPGFRTRSDDDDRDRIALTRCNHLRDRAPLGAKAEAVRSVLDVAPRERFSRSRDERGADEVTGIWSVRVPSNRDCGPLERRPVDLRRHP
jgi:hypothetical protein